jgi:hypothetical protein
VPLGAGCHGVYIVGRSARGVETRYPSTSSFTIAVAGAACAASLPQAAAGCGGTTPPPPAPDLGQPPPPMDALTVELLAPTAGQVVAAYSVVTIRAASPNATAVTALWTRSGATTRYQLNQDASGAWTLALRLGGAGERTVSLEAGDASGHQATTSPITFTAR